MKHTHTMMDIPPDSPAGGLGARAIEMRWVLVASAFLAVGAWFFFALPLLMAALGFLAMACVALFAPTRPKLRRLRAVQERSMRRVWPGTGMKVTVDALSSPCFIADARGITRYVNKAAIEVYGAVRPGDPLSFALRVPSLLEAFDRVSASGTAEKISWSEKVPTESWFEAHLTPVFMPVNNVANVPDFILVVVQDQTEQRRMERMRSDFIANASHELRTPLASLSGFIETLQGSAKDDPQARDKFLSIMHEQASRMRRLIDDILSLSRIEMKSHVKPATTVDLVYIVQHSVEAMVPLAKDMQVEIQATLPEGAAMVRGDQDELIQITENLIENALKYASSGKKIDVMVQGREGFGGWILSVRDYGEGIAAEHLPRLTERFYRVDVDSSRAMRGTGLGLAIVKHIVTRHRARLEVESTPGEGATFAVHFIQP